jgi:hypothetical protein
VSERVSDIGASSRLQGPFGGQALVLVLVLVLMLVLVLVWLRVPRRCQRFNAGKRYGGSVGR